MIFITEIAPVFPEYEDVLRLRNNVLRKPLGLSISKDEVVKEADQIHLAAFERNKIVGCVLLMPDKDEIKLRQMAVLESSRGMGIGLALLTAAENLAKDRGFSVMTCHARESAVGFYQAHGWKVEGERFIQVSIPHFAMRKVLRLRILDIFGG